MAMVITDGSEIEGKLGGVIFRRDQCKAHIQAGGSYWNREVSPKQKKRRRAFRVCTNYIKGHASEYFVARWQEYANWRPKKNNKGQWSTLTWWQQFLSYNLNPVIEGKPITEFPP